MDFGRVSPLGIFFRDATILPVERAGACHHVSNRGNYRRALSAAPDATGRPFQEGCTALHVEPGLSLAEVVPSIHLNPVRAKVVTAEQWLTYRGSSLPLFVGGQATGLAGGGDDAG